MSNLKPYTAILRDKRRGPKGLSSLGEWLAASQGIYYTLTGLWPLLSLGSFQMVTGTKTDLWLVQTVAALVLVMGLVLIIAAIRSVLTLELGLLMVGTSLVFGVIDVVYVVRGVLPQIYLADAVEQFLMMILCLAFLHRFTHRRHSTFV